MDRHDDSDNQSTRDIVTNPDASNLPVGEGEVETSAQSFGSESGTGFSFDRKVLVDSLKSLVSSLNLKAYPEDFFVWLYSPSNPVVWELLNQIGGPEPHRSMTQANVAFLLTLFHAGASTLAERRISDTVKSMLERQAREPHNAYRPAESSIDTKAENVSNDTDDTDEAKGEPST